MLEANGIRKRFGGLQALSGADVSLGANEIVGLVGPNGSGKTTMLNVLSGFVRPDGGEVLFQGKPVHGLSPWDISARGLRRTFQHPGMPGRMTGRELLLCGGSLPTAGTIRGSLFRRERVRQERRRALEKAEQLLETLLLTHVADIAAADLSGGQQKLLSLGVVLMNEPAALLLDEPTAGVNPTLRRSLIESLRRIRDNGTALLIVEHDMGFITALCDRVFVLDKGTDVVCCRPEELKDHPEVVEAYLGKPRDHVRGRTARTERI